MNIHIQKYTYKYVHVLDIQYNNKHMHIWTHLYKWTRASYSMEPTLFLSWNREDSYTDWSWQDTDIQTYFLSSQTIVNHVNDYIYKILYGKETFCIV